jgi:hypothetical protein
MSKKNMQQFITRVMQKRDSSRVAVKKSACGAVMIDGSPFSVSVESDGAPSSKGVVFTLSGKSVESGAAVIGQIDVIYPAAGGTKTLSRKSELYEKKDGGRVFRARFPEVKIPACESDELFLQGAVTEEQLVGTMNSQIIFKFTPRYSAPEEDELMINIYPVENPLDGSCTEWVSITADREFFEHGGLARIMKNKAK